MKYESSQIDSILDITPPFSFLFSFKMLPGNAFLAGESCVNLSSLQTFASCHLPSSGSPLPLSIMTEIMLQNSAMTIYCNYDNFVKKAFVFSTKIRCYAPIYEGCSELTATSEITSFKHSIVSISSKLLTGDKPCAAGKFEYSY